MRTLVDIPDNQLAAGRAFAFSLEALKAADQEQQSLLDIKA